MFGDGPWRYLHTAPGRFAASAPAAPRPRQCGGVGSVSVTGRGGPTALPAPKQLMQGYKQFVQRHFSKRVAQAVPQDGAKALPGGQDSDSKARRKGVLSKLFRPFAS